MKKGATETQLKLPPFVRKHRKIARSQIITAKYNPRVMPTERKKALRESIDKFGLVDYLLFNEKTGVLVGGHQRLEQMDSKMGYPYGKTKDYLVPVVVVDLDEKEEQALNIILNNPNLQGSFDFSKLEKLYENGANPFASGFTSEQLQTRFDSAKVRSWLERDAPKEFAALKRQEEQQMVSQEQDQDTQELEDKREIPDFLRPENDPEKPLSIAGKSHQQQTPNSQNNLFPIGVIFESEQKQRWDKFKQKHKLVSDKDTVLFLLEKVENETP